MMKVKKIMQPMDDQERKIYSLKLRIWIVVSCFLGLILVGSNVAWYLYSQKLSELQEIKCSCDCIHNVPPVMSGPIDEPEGGDTAIDDSDSAVSDVSDADADTYVYTLNLKRKTKYHRLGCSSISNKETIKLTREKAQSYGKGPCRRCNP